MQLTHIILVIIIMIIMMIIGNQLTESLALKRQLNSTQLTHRIVSWGAEQEEGQHGEEGGVDAHYRRHIRQECVAHSWEREDINIMTQRLS